MYATVSGNDWRNESFKVKDIAYKLRNLHLRSRIAEFSIVSEYFFRSISGRKSSPYMSAGLGLFYFNPQAKYKGKWYDLQPLGTDEEVIDPKLKKYKRLQDALLLGTGWKFKLSERYSLTAEAGLRLTSTDYIDDVSGNYYDKGELYQHNGALSAILSDRSGDTYEYLNNYQLSNYPS